MVTFIEIFKSSLFQKLIVNVRVKQNWLFQNQTCTIIIATFERLLNAFNCCVKSCFPMTDQPFCHFEKRMPQYTTWNIDAIIYYKFKFRTIFISTNLLSLYLKSLIELFLYIKSTIISRFSNSDWSFLNLINALQHVQLSITFSVTTRKSKNLF